MGVAYIYTVYHDGRVIYRGHNGEEADGKFEELETTGDLIEFAMQESVDAPEQILMTTENRTTGKLDALESESGLQVL